MLRKSANNKSNIYIFFYINTETRPKTPHCYMRAQHFTTHQYHNILKIAFRKNAHATQITNSTAKENELENFKQITVSTARDR